MGEDCEQLETGLPVSGLTDERPGEQACAPVWKGSGCVLFVDDEESILSMGRRMLERGGYSVLTAADGLEAVQVFQRHKDEIRLVVLDMTMPRMDGEACFGELRRLAPNVKIILTSGYSEQDVIARFKGLTSFMQKPYTSAELLPRIRELLNA